MNNSAIVKKRLDDKPPVVKLEVVPDIKQGGKMFAPQYLKKDPEMGGRPSMRFYNHAKTNRLFLGQSVQARVKKIRDTGKINQKGFSILQVEVEII